MPGHESTQRRTLQALLVEEGFLQRKRNVDDAKNTYRLIKIALEATSFGVGRIVNNDVRC